MNTIRVASLTVASLLSLSVTGCTGGDHRASSTTAAAPDASHVDALRASFRVSVAQDARRSGDVPHDAPVLSRSEATQIDREGASFLPRVPTLPATSIAKRGEVILPLHANEPFTLRDTLSNMRVSVAMRGATPAEGAIEDGFVVYPAGHTSGATILHRPRVEGTEDWIHFASRPEEEALHYVVNVSDVAGLRLVSDSLEMLDAGGTPRLRMAPPYGVDASGNAIPGHVSVVGCHVDTSPKLPWGREVTAPGAKECEVVVSWSSKTYPLLLDPSWTTTGSMAAVRSGHTATPIQGGMTLAAGGLSVSNTTTTSVEVFNPSGSGTWAGTGSLNGRRMNHTASRLSDGRVLVTGGSGGDYTSAEIYDPTAGTWSNAPSLPVGRANHTASVLADGRVLVAGGSYDKTADIFDPSGGGSWSVTGSLNLVRSFHTATVLTDGRVLVAGSVNPSNGGLGDPTAEIFNAGTWTSIPPMTTARQQHVAALLADGRVLVAGGFDGSGIDTATAEIFNPTSGTWKTTGSMSTGRLAFTSAVLSDGRVLVAGGMQDYQPSGDGLASTEIFDPTGAGTWSSAGSLSTIRFTHTATVLADGRVLEAGGLATRFGLPLASCDMFTWLATGAACVDTAACASGTCVSGYCCNTTCSGANQACAQTLTGLANGTCGPIENGTTCSSGTTCGSGFCSSSVCCNQACTGTNQSCLKQLTGLADGTCGPIENGTTCASGSTCGSGNCIEGVCCDAPCSGLCTSCLVAKNGVATGKCLPDTAGTDPDNQCNPAGSGTCALPGVCNGAGSCQSEQGTTCAPSSCAGPSTVQPASSCNTAGQCAAPGTASCAPYVCKGTACLNTCTGDTDCVSPTKCISGACGNGKGVGASCATGQECSSNYCVSGVCCGSACGGTCQACSLALTGQADGTCASTKLGLDPKNECTASGGACGPNGNCDGHGACATSAAAGTSCGAATCGSGTVIVPACDGAGTCKSTPNSCGAFACSGGACETSCGSNADCASSDYCSGSTCVPKLNTGTTCSTDLQCGTGHCVENLCCDSPCTGACQSCVGLNTQSGANGHCDSVKDGLDPKNLCIPDSNNTCGADGLCGANGACRTASAAGKTCGSTVCVGSASVSGQVCDGNGSCGTEGATTCANGYVCSAGSCLTSCGASTDCKSGFFCSASSCVPLLGSGASCSDKSQCASAFCVEGVCCQTACTGSCDSCVGSLTVGGVTGQCDSVKAGLDPNNGCAADGGNACGADGACDGKSSCRTFAVSGTVCGGNVCTSDEVAAQQCDGSGSCKPVAPTPCTAGYDCESGSCLTGCATTSDCTNGYFCQSGACVAKLQKGLTCGDVSECATGFCVDGVCCDSACTGSCQSCAGVKTVGGVDGVCDNVSSGTDPRNACSADSSNPCGADGDCDGNGACRIFAASGSSCGTTACSGPLVSGKLCDGAGTCAKSAGKPCPDGFVCEENACLEACVAATDCATGYFCRQGQCVVQEDIAASCSQDLQCGSGHCVDGVCCSTTCDGACVSCNGNVNQSGVSGTCDNVKEGTNPRMMCTPGATPCDADGACGAMGQCRKFAAQNTPCGAAMCSGSSATTEACDGFGACNTTSTPCAPYACDTTAKTCKAKCLQSSDCASGAMCDVGTGECAITSGTCSDEFTVMSASGSKTSCLPYKCAAGACETACSVAADCSPGYMCNAPTCVKTSGAGGSGGASGAGGAVGVGGAAGVGGVGTAGASGGSGVAGTTAKGGATSTATGGASTGTTGGSSGTAASMPSAVAPAGSSGGCHVGVGEEGRFGWMGVGLIAVVAAGVRRRRTSRRAA